MINYWKSHSHDLSDNLENKANKSENFNLSLANNLNFLSFYSLINLKSTITSDLNNFKFE
ncbi:hypothetical protein DERP_003229 [Dermatophagoides pteronyssinus]|uniref:Uncharacterized protein n=1 Tax=Dermatophagoides pteronyssinus TaxID=6956 RepID=A0ABQ8JJ81_DERPT|nr:hypothetical protein DERP_003229 [Dermatophagoides pteronyssinus]